uniref:Uncharacterized protein n=1 Tax=Xanthomonas phage fSU1 TaxID=3238781 RepID=A0AB39CER8_9VIRU
MSGSARLNAIAAIGVATSPPQEQALDQLGDISTRLRQIVGKHQCEQWKCHAA